MRQIGGRYEGFIEKNNHRSPGRSAGSRDVYRLGEKKVDGTKTVATVDGTDVPMGVLSLFAREQQAQTIAMYQQFMGGSASNIWSGVADEDTGETYGESAVKSALKQVEILYVMKEKAADYNVEITEDEQKAIEDAAAAFMKDNDEGSDRGAFCYRGPGEDFAELGLWEESRILSRKKAILRFLRMMHSSQPLPMLIFHCPEMI